MLKKFRLMICIFVFMACFSTMGLVHAIEQENPILIISSYNPDAHNTTVNISEFMDEYNKLGGTRGVQIENMNCRSFSEAPLWKTRMAGILHKYKDENKPSSIILLGQEAWSSFLSLNAPEFIDVPVLCAMTSKNGIFLPDEHIDSLQNWMPESVDFITESPAYQIRGGFVYDYDLKSNIRFIKELYPSTRNIVFISDNSYGGVSLQAFVRKGMEDFPELNLQLLDGRSNTIYSISDQLRNLPENSAIILGTWRVDKNDGYFMRNATYAMMESAPDVPAFSISSIGFGYWVLGGFMPNYRTFGKEMAHQVKQILLNPTDTTSHVVTISNSLRLDYNKMQDLGVELAALPPNAILINKPLSFYEQYKYEIWIVTTIVASLSIALLVSLISYSHTKKLKDELEISGKELLIAKDKAEESNRLKSTFIANMSHEIRTPLNSIVGFANVLAIGDTPKEDAQMYYEIIQSNSDLLLRLINDILDISRLETGKVILQYEKCEIISLSRQTLESVSYSKKSNNKFIFESELTDLEIEADPQRLQQVIINLLSNAIKFTDDGIITLKVEIEKDTDIVIFSVTDTGIGIPVDKQSLVFERFEKLNEHKQGTGLGLSISKLIVEKSGGEIWVDPDYKNGARFIFTHPMQRKEDLFGQN